MAQLLTLIVSDVDDVIENVYIEIFNEALDTLITTSTTDSEGTTILSLPEDVLYKIFLFKQGHSFTRLPIEVMLDEDTTLNITANKIPEVISPTGYVKLYGELKQLDGNPFVAQKVNVQLTKTSQSKENTTFSKMTSSTLSDENGYFYFLLPGNLHVTLAIPSCNFSQSGLLPYSGQLQYTKLGL
jgi:hypothetical protein